MPNTEHNAQARLASLMAALIGLPFPRNAVETLPLEYLEIPLGTPHIRQSRPDI